MCTFICFSFKFCHSVRKTQPKKFNVKIFLLIFFSNEKKNKVDSNKKFVLPKSLRLKG